MKHKLTPEQEQFFWECIAIDIEHKTPFGHPSNWQDRDIKEFEKEMKAELWELRYDSTINFLCEIVYSNDLDNFDKSKLAQTSMTAIIRDIFIYKTARKRHAKIKNRFTYFLKNMSFDEYVEAFNIIETKEIVYLHTSVKTGHPIPIFISYSHKDQKYKEQLIKHLTPLRRLNKVNIWDDKFIEAGKEWEKEIFDKLNKAKIILCLISSDFIASEFCYTKELGKALEAHQEGQKVVIPIRIRVCNWNELPISKIQGLPKHWLKAIEDDSVWTEIAMGIEKVVNKIINS